MVGWAEMTRPDRQKRALLSESGFVCEKVLFERMRSPLSESAAEMSLALCLETA
jgi:hypothetical protein